MNKIAEHTMFNFPEVWHNCLHHRDYNVIAISYRENICIDRAK